MRIGEDPMKLPENFSFSQYNLQDYADCKFRFLLKHLKRLEWPAIESEPLVLQEIRMELGQQFHRLVQQYFIGVAPDDLRNSIRVPELMVWWDAFLELGLNEQEGEKHAEKVMSSSVNGFRLLAKYDLLVRKNPLAFTIYDWKTSASQPSLKQLAQRLQTRVYPFVFYLSLNHSPIPPLTFPEIEMIYWYPTFPDTPLRFTYSQSDFEEDMDYLTRLITEISNLPEEEFHQTTEIKRCAYCRYRSLCERGISAGKLEPGMDEDTTGSEFSIDFDEI